MTLATRPLWAAFVLLIYAAFCAALYLRRRAEKRRAESAAAALIPAVDGATAVLVAYASQTGYAEQIAWQTARALHTAGVPAMLRPLGEVTPAELHTYQRALFVASTYGEGDAPDAAAAFARRTMAIQPDLSGLSYGVLALGDREYAHFCGFGRRLDAWLSACRAQPLFERVELDNADPKALLDWQHLVGRVAGTSDLAEWEAPLFEPWRLARRVWLNEGSLGGPCFLIELQGAQDATWEAGDLVQVLAPGGDDRPREYSVACVPRGGVLQLLVRQERHSDGTLGLASGWLTQGAQIGGDVALRLRPHRNFRIGDNASRPLVLIGNGTGLAGLRAHLQARAAAPGAARAWLLYGERNAAHDAHFRDEIDAWQQQGVLTHVDWVFSRDQPERRYVQHRLQEQAARLREWVAGGAAIYVCGSLEGMAAGVDAVLGEVLGPDATAHLADAGRYRRDVY